MVEEKAEVVEKKEKKQRKGRYTHRQWGVVTATSPTSDILMTWISHHEKGTKKPEDPIQ